MRAIACITSKYEYAKRRMTGIPAIRRFDPIEASPQDTPSVGGADLSPCREDRQFPRKEAPALITPSPAGWKG